MPRPATTAAGRPVHPDWCNANRGAATLVLEDRCTITRDPVVTAATPPMNTVTGQYSRTPTTVVTDLPCRVSYAGQGTAKRGVWAEEVVESQDHIIQLPIDWTDVRPEDVITITASADPGQIGRRYKAVKVSAATYSWARLVRCEHLD